MDLIADIFLVAGALGAALYCYVLEGRLKSFATLETGMGGAIAVLSAQVDDMTRALEQARGAAIGSAAQLEGLTTRGGGIAARLELLLAAMHDLPEPATAVPTPVTVTATRAKLGRRLRAARRRIDPDAAEDVE